MIDSSLSPKGVILRLQNLVLGVQRVLPLSQTCGGPYQRAWQENLGGIVWRKAGGPHCLLRQSQSLGGHISLPLISLPLTTNLGQWAIIGSLKESPCLEKSKSLIHGLQHFFFELKYPWRLIPSKFYSVWPAPSTVPTTLIRHSKHFWMEEEESQKGCSNSISPHDYQRPGSLVVLAWEVGGLGSTQSESSCIKLASLLFSLALSWLILSHL